ncbi:hypothetical protein C8J56DRAFT_462444 [Mycena floridula]|nr:hypothetical protein C8J56DRAFT_462444 [Mycena floridula]
MFTPSAEETVLVAQILAEASSKHGERDSITPEQALDILVGARLEPDVLLAILALAVTEQTLSRTELGVAVRLIGWAQEGISITPPLVHRCGPAAVITGLPIIHRNSKTRKSSKEGDSVPPNPSAYPPLNSACRERYVAVFKTGKPVDGVLNGNKVWKAFNVSNLPIKTLAGIWDLVDTKGTGDLTLHEFVLGMYFVDGIMRRRFDSIPSEVPSFLHSQVNDPVPLLITHPKHRWVVTSAIRETAAASFGTLDPENQGYISPDVFFDYIADSKLPEDDLNEIWHLADIGDKGQLTRDEFALALFLMHMKLAGMYLPTVLPPDFIPKSSPSSPTTSDLRSPKKSTPEWVIPSPVQANATDAFAILDVGGKAFGEGYSSTLVSH